MYKIKTPASFSKVVPWASMDGKSKAIFLGKLGIMLCTMGYIFGDSLVDGVVYETYVLQ